eukprot:2916178-Rhodomonas_salina.1
MPRRRRGEDQAGQRRRRGVKKRLRWDGDADSEEAWRRRGGMPRRHGGEDEAVRRRHYRGRVEELRR